MDPTTLQPPGLAPPGLRGQGFTFAARPRADRYRITADVGEVGSCSGEQIIHFKAFDNSGSMAGGNDPIGKRFLEVDHAVDHLGRHCHCKHEYVSLIHFDTPTSGDVMPTRPNREGIAALQKGLAVPRDGAGISKLGPSLHRINDIVAKNPGYQASITVLSDFELFDPPDVLDQLASFPGPVHAVVFRSAPPAALIDDDRILVTRIQPTDEPGAVARAMIASFAQLRTPPKQRGRRSRPTVAPSW